MEKVITERDVISKLRKEFSVIKSLDELKILAEKVTSINE